MQLNTIKTNVFIFHFSRGNIIQIRAVVLFASNPSLVLKFSILKEALGTVLRSTYS